VELVQQSDDDPLHTLGILGALIGPLFGILIAGYYICSRQRVWVDDMYVMDTNARYWFRRGYNPNAVAAVLIAGIPTVAFVIISGGIFAGSTNITLHHLGDDSWFLGCGLGFLAFWLLERNNPRIGRLEENLELATDGTGQ
jgi:nucleobase:cation symporter-1, NCS1 family